MSHQHRRLLNAIERKSLVPILAIAIKGREAETSRRAVRKPCLILSLFSFFLGRYHLSTDSTNT